MKTEEEYKAEVLQLMRDLYPTLEGEEKERAERLFPELKECEDEIKGRVTLKSNGVYPETDGVRIWSDGHTFKVPFDWDKGEHALLTKEGYKRSKNDKDGLQNEADALLDWDFATATEKIQELGTDIPLGENEYLPTAPVYLAMYKYRKMLNEALREAGAKEIDFSKDTWFAQRGDVINAWFFGGNGGYLGSNDVYNAYACRAVTF